MPFKRPTCLASPDHESMSLCGSILFILGIELCYVFVYTVSIMKNITNA